MKKLLLLLSVFLISCFAFGQNLKPIAQKVHEQRVLGKNFVKYDLFTEEVNAKKTAEYAKAATDITVMKLKTAELGKIVKDKPATLEISFPFEGKNLTVELVKNDIFAEGFSVNTDKGSFNYTPGVYYNGIIKGDETSVVAFSFFNDDVVGIASKANVGNITLAKAENSGDFVSYNDQKLTASNPFTCGTDELEYNIQNKLESNPFPLGKSSQDLTNTCVRIYYEIGRGPFAQNGSDPVATTNWVTSMFNNVKTLYNNDGINVAISEIFIWTTQEPYPDVSTTVTPGDVLASFKAGRPNYNGDAAQLLKTPDNTSVAYVNTLCTNSAYSFCGVKKQYSTVPVYSWNIMVMAHELGHNLASPHTHACFWNGNDTAIDGCGPAAGYNEGCNAPLPTGGGTIMSYCHLVSGVGINFTKGFGDQVAALIRNTMESKSCLGTDCINSCPNTITGVTTSEITNNSVKVNITDNTGTSWKYRVTTYGGTVIASGITNDKIFTVNGLSEGTFYKISVGLGCSGPDAFVREMLILTNADWCSGVPYTDTGGENGNYENSQIIINTFYPSSPGQKMKLTFTEFDLASGDYMNVYDGKNTAAPRLGTQLTGSTIPGPFQATNADGVITVRFVSNTTGVAAGWKSSFECITLGTNEVSGKESVKVSPNPTKGIVNITTSDNILSYEIFDVSGRLVNSAKDLKVTNQTVDLSKNAAGTYMIKVKTDKETVTKKVIKY